MARFRAALVLLSLASVLMPASSAQTDARDRNSPQTPTAGANQVRLRKMHLVRPDLIPYPAYQDFYA